MVDDQLFDSCKRTEMSPMRSGEGWYRFLNRSGTDYYAQVRNLVSSWLDHIPDEHRKPLRASLQSDDDQVFESAFWELYLHEIYTRSGFDVTIHPLLPSSEKHPDFLMINGSESFYLEAVRVGKSVEELGRDRRLAEVMAVLESVKGSRFTVSFSYLKIGPGAISAKRLGGVITAWLDELDPEAVMAGLPEDNVFANLPSMEWESDGWVLEFHALPVKPEAWEKGLSLIGMKGMGEAVMVDNVSGQLKVLKHKANRYGALDHPLVIAVMSNTDIPTKDYEVSEALFGRLNRSPEAAAEDARTNVFSDGHWLTPKGWRRGHVSPATLNDHHGDTFNNHQFVDMVSPSWSSWAA